MTSTATESKVSASFEELAAHLARLSHMRSVSALVAWDQETYMPPKGAPARAEQAALMASMMHELQTSPKTADLIAACEAEGRDAGSQEAAAVRLARREAAARPPRGQPARPPVDRLRCERHPDHRRRRRRSAS